jgi:hypothetical protein
MNMGTHGQQRPLDAFFPEEAAEFRAVVIADDADDPVTGDAEDAKLLGDEIATEPPGGLADDELHSRAIALCDHVADFPARMWIG